MRLTVWVLGAHNTSNKRSGKASLEVTVDSHLEDFRKLTRCKIGLRQETRKQLSSKEDKLEQKMGGSMANSEKPNLFISCSIWFLRKIQRSQPQPQGPARSIPWLLHLLPILIFLLNPFSSLHLSVQILHLFLHIAYIFYAIFNIPLMVIQLMNIWIMLAWLYNFVHSG